MTNIIRLKLSHIKNYKTYFSINLILKNKKKQLEKVKITTQAKVFFWL